MSDDAPSLFELFRSEVEEHCRALSDGLLSIERDGLSKERAAGLMRAAHSIKGAARVMGLDAAVSFAHEVEDVFDRYRAGTEPIHRGRIDQLLRATDLLAALAVGSEIDAAQWGERNAGDLNALLTELAAPAPADEVRPLARSEASALPQVEASGAPMVTPIADPSAPRAASPAGSPGPQETNTPAPPRSSPTTPALAPAASAAPGAGGVGALVSGGTATIDAAAPKAAESESRVVRVAADHLDRMMRLAGESMVEARRAPLLRADLAQLKEQIQELRRTTLQVRHATEDPRLAELTARVEDLERLLRRHTASLDGVFHRGEEAATALYHEVLASRMRPFSEITSGHARLVRDLARQLGKEVTLELIGGSTPVDRDILAKLESPVTHMLRNAVDHGIESPAERTASGKAIPARIELEARHQASQLIVEIRDDGRGIDPGAVRRRAIERGLISPDMSESLSRTEIHDFLFLPGFTTASTVSDVSGRGVGLDVVQRMVQAASGTISVRSEPGEGTVFTLRLPITLSVIRAALVEIAGEPYALPLARLDRIVRVSAERLQPVEGRMQFELDGRSIGLIQASRVLDLPHTEVPSSHSSVILLEDGSERYGLIVDRFLGEQDLVVRSLDPRLGRVPHVSAAAHLDDGSVTIILDVEDLLASVRRALEEDRGDRLGVKEKASPDIRRRRRILVVDDSITVREVERQLLQRLGYEVETAVDGADGWNLLRRGSFDLLITDVDMPRMNGIELVRLARRDPRFASLPIAIVSYKDREEDRQAGLDAGANAYLTKGSFQDDRFAQTVARLAGAPQA
ncbi:MAG: hybrid sensor histidine kinase/response regulator [Phycisphaeraceae bacterium]|nr:hybrid sensor histidine kinase/response regulator [Phycisphaeraceae bacterium]